MRAQRASKPPVTVRAAAKINLHLGVGAPREDGFHPLETVYHAVSLCDDVTVEDADDWSLDLATAAWIDADDVPTDNDNLVAKAAAALGAHHGRELTAAVALHKAIPVAGGLAGGSADGAAALVALDRLYDLGTSDDDLLRLAAGLGSDVPFALLGGTALGTGRGERVEPIDDTGSWWWVLVPSGDGMSTPEVYRHHDRVRPDASPSPRPATELIDAVASGEPVALARALHNDLQEPAIDLRPALGDLLDRGQAAGALRGIVSGSGPTCAFLCGSADDAREVAAELQSPEHPVTLVAHGPVAGAHVVR